jgi:hypothetical protein
MKKHALKTYGEWRLASPFLNSALDGGEWSVSRPGRFTPGGKESPVPIGQRKGGPHNRYERCGVEKNLLTLPGIEPRPTRRYTDWAISTPN